MTARLLLATFLLLTALPVHAADPRQAQAATAMGHQAADAFTAGDFAKAARQYLNAFRLDPTQSALLYGAARAEQMSDQSDLALQHYAEFLQMPGIESARADNARKYVTEIHGLQADAKAREADNANKAGTPGVAAQLYAEAADLAPKRLDWRLKSAVALLDAGRTDEAKDRLRALLAEPNGDSAVQAQAQARLDALEGHPSSPIGNNAGRVVQPASRPSKAVAWSLIGGGAVLALAGLGVGLSTMSDAAAWHRDESARSGGLIVGSDFTTASTTVSSLNQRTGVAIGMGAGGLAATGIGVWLLLRGDTPKTAWSVTPSGVVVSRAF